MNTLHTDERGEIIQVAEKADVLRITSNVGSRRANHFHRESGHWCLVISGMINYYERPVGAKESAAIRTYFPGDLFWTGPMVEHLMVFAQDTQFYCFSTGARDPAHYEADTVRLSFELDQA